MAYAQDSVVEYLPITLDLIEGKGLIAEISIETSTESYSYQPSDEETQTGWQWSGGITPLVKARELVTIGVFVRNYGDEDNLYCELDGPATNESSIQVIDNVSFNEVAVFIYTFTMPHYDVMLNAIYVGHIE